MRHVGIEAGTSHQWKHEARGMEAPLTEPLRYSRDRISPECQESWLSLSWVISLAKHTRAASFIGWAMFMLLGEISENALRITFSGSQRGVCVCPVHGCRQHSTIYLQFLFTCKNFHILRPLFFFLIFIYYLFIYFIIFLKKFLAVLGLRFCVRAFSSCGE